MVDIVLRKVNEAFLYVDCENHGIYHELNDRFSFFVKGYKFMPKYKNGMWDGKIRLFSAQTRKIYFGLIGELYKFAKSSNYSIDVDAEIKQDYANTEFNFDPAWLELPFEPAKTL